MNVARKCARSWPVKGLPRITCARLWIKASKRPPRIDWRVHEATFLLRNWNNREKIFSVSCDSSEASFAQFHACRLRSKGELNKIMYAVDWGDFDSEVFSDVMRDILGALSTIPPVRIAKKAGAARVEGAPRARQPKTNWRGGPAITALWEAIPPQTRAPVEEKVRDWRPPKRSGICSFLDHLIGLLEQHRPVVKKRRRPIFQGRYLRNIAEIWRHFGLRVGLAYDGENGRSIDSHFQRFARLALRSAGDEASKVSADQIRKIKRVNKG